MANEIKLKRGSGSDPGTSDLSVGEIAIRTDTAKLFTKNDAGSVVEVSGGLEDGDKGDITVSSSGATFTIDNGVINNAKVSSSAAIAGSKISPDFGSQNIVTTGTLGSSDISITNSEPTLNLVDSNNNSDFAVRNNDGTFGIRDTTNAAERFTINSSGTASVAGNLDVGAGVDVTGNITVSGTVDGRDVATDGTKLDGIASGATNVTNTNQLTNGAGFITATLTNEQVQDIVGDMVTGNTETGITVTYQDGDGTLDFVVGTLNQDTTGNAATATALETARNIGGVSFDGTANINLPGVNTSGNQDTSGTAAIATTVTVADESSDTTCFPLFATAATGNLAPKSGSNLAFNSSNGTLTATAFSGDGSALTGISAGATGGGSDEVFYENDQTVTTNYTITNGKNAMAAGPITINSGVTVTVGSGETLTIV